MSVHKMSAPQLQKRIRELAKDTGNIVLTTHAKARMAQRNVIASEVFECLRQGRLRRQPEPDLEHGAIKCHMEWFLAGRTLIACAALSDDFPDAVVVTVMAQR